MTMEAAGPEEGCRSGCRETTQGAQAEPKAGAKVVGTETEKLCREQADTSGVEHSCWLGAGRDKEGFLHCTSTSQPQHLEYVLQSSWLGNLISRARVLRNWMYKGWLGHLSPTLGNELMLALQVWPWCCRKWLLHEQRYGSLTITPAPGAKVATSPLSESDTLTLDFAACETVRSNF